MTLSRATRDERRVATFGDGRVSLANACYDAAKGDPLLALDLAVNMIVRFHTSVVQRRMRLIREEAAA